MKMGWLFDREQTPQVQVAKNAGSGGRHGTYSRLKNLFDLLLILLRLKVFSAFET